MISFFKNNIKDKHDFILYNKEEGKFYDKNFLLINNMKIYLMINQLYEK